MTDSLPVPQHPAVDLLHPELWLLLTDPAVEPHAAKAVRAQLQALASQNPLAAWRLAHNRVRCISPGELAAEVEAALAAGCPAVRLHASLSAEALGQTLSALNLPAATERIINRHLWGQPLAAWWPQVQAELTRPDAWVEVGWRLSRGQAIPPLAMPGDDESGRSYQAAFKAWRAERFRLGDSGQLPGDDDDDAPVHPSAEAEAVAGRDIDNDLDIDSSPGTDPAPTWQLPPPVQGRAAVGRLGIGAMAALGAQGTSAASRFPWFPVVELKGEALARSGDPLPAGVPARWAYSLHIERQSPTDADDAAWLAVRVRVQWDDTVVAAQARRHSHRLVLLPRLQAPVVLKLLPGVDRAYFPMAAGDLGRMKLWPEALPGTAATLIPLPLSD
jgi:hypothetical protein